MFPNSWVYFVCGGRGIWGSSILLRLTTYSRLILQTKETKGFPQRGGASLCKLISSRNVAEKWAKWTGVRSSDSTVIPFVCFAMAKMPHQRVLKSCLCCLFLRAQKNLKASYFTYIMTYKRSREVREWFMISTQNDSKREVGRRRL